MIALYFLLNNIRSKYGNWGPSAVSVVRVCFALPCVLELGHQVPSCRHLRAGMDGRGELAAGTAWAGAWREAPSPLSWAPVSW